MREGGPDVLAEEIALASERRAAWNARQAGCAVHRLMGDVVPHDARGPHHLCSRNQSRPDIYEYTWNWLAVCPECHRAYHNGKITHETMALAKALANPAEFDIRAMADLRPAKFLRLLPWRK